MQKNWQGLGLIALSVAALSGCSGASFHEDAGKRLEGNDWAGAVQEYKQAVEADKTRNVNLRLELANAAMHTKDAASATEAGRDATSIEPGNAQAHLALAKALMIKEPPQTNEAMSEFDNAFTCDNKCVEAALGSGAILEAKGDNKGAVEKYRAAVKANPNSADAHKSLALALSKLGDMANAEAENKEATRLQAMPPAKPAS